MAQTQPDTMLDAAEPTGETTVPTQEPNPGKPGFDSVGTETIAQADKPLTPDEAVVVMQDFVWQSYQRDFRYPRGTQHVTEAFRMFVGDQWDQEIPGVKLVTINHTNQICLEVAHLMTEAPLHPQLSAKHDKSRCWYVLTAQGMAKFQGQNVPGGDGSLLTEDQWKTLMSMPDPRTGQPMVGADDFKEITVEGARDRGQSMLDDMWETSGADMTIDVSVLMCVMGGYSCMWWRRDPDHWGFALEPWHPLHVYPDPGHELEQHFDGIAADQAFALDKAIHLWPEHEAIFRTHAQSGSTPLIRLGPQGAELSDSYLNALPWKQKMVAIRKGYLKHQKYPASEQVALDRQMVLKSADGAYTLPDGTPTDPAQDNWPVVRDGLREITVVDTTLLSDQRCEEPDIPLIWNICRPVPGQPQGSGYAALIRDLNVTLNMMATIIKAYFGYYQSPSEDMPESVKKLMKDDEGRPLEGTSAGMRSVIPDDLWIMFKGDVRKFHAPPPMAGEMFKFCAWLSDTLKELSGHVDVLSGEQTPDAKSGIAIEQLQNAAKGIFSLLAKRTEHAVGRVGKLTLNLLTSGWVPASQWEKVLGDSDEPQVLAAYRTVFMRTDWDVNVESMAGSLQTRKRKEAQARADYAASRPLATLEATLEATGDPAPAQTARDIRLENGQPQPGETPAVQPGAIPGNTEQLPVGS